jgi:hypothetical protein
MAAAAAAPPGSDDEDDDDAGPTGFKLAPSAGIPAGFIQVSPNVRDYVLGTMWYRDERDAIPEWVAEFVTMAARPNAVWMNPPGFAPVTPGQIYIGKSGKSTYGIVQNHRVPTKMLMRLDWYMNGGFIAGLDSKTAGMVRVSVSYLLNIVDVVQTMKPVPPWAVTFIVDLIYHEHTVEIPVVGGAPRYLLVSARKRLVPDPMDGSWYEFYTRGYPEAVNLFHGTVTFNAAAALGYQIYIPTSTIESVDTLHFPLRRGGRGALLKTLAKRAVHANPNQEALFINMAAKHAPHLYERAWFDTPSYTSMDPPPTTRAVAGI